MQTHVLDGDSLYDLLNDGYRNLAAHYKIINDLNVFPIPDGDTGTNMKLTLLGGLEAVKDKGSISAVASSFAHGCIFSARGNSGVLTSQYFAGLAKGLIGKKDAGVQEFAQAMVEAYKTAYRATDVPTEGTILTIAREGIEKTLPLLQGNEDFTSFFSLVIQAMKNSLDNTPNLLDVLKQAGVVDSGGKGLLTVFEGFYAHLTGQAIEEGDNDLGIETTHGTPLPMVDLSAFNEDSDLEYGYCTEFLLQLLRSKGDVNSFDLPDFIKNLRTWGNSIVCFQTGTIVKVHIHTKTPSLVIAYAQKYGEFVSFKMENMTLQHNEVVQHHEEKSKERKKWAIVAIAQGEGLLSTFSSLGASRVIDGGATMNTSTAEILDAVNFANAETTILLPNESNILMAASQAQKLSSQSKILIVPTKNIAQGYAAMANLMGEEESGEEVYQEMQEGAEGVATGFLAKANRESALDGVSIKPGQYIASLEGKAVGAEDSLPAAFLRLLDAIPGIERREAAFAFAGQGADEATQEGIRRAVHEKYPRLELSFSDGGQQVYDYLVGVY